MDIDGIARADWKRICKEIEVKTRQLVAKPCFRRDDEDDIRQDLWISVLEALPLYAPPRGTLGAFIGCVVRNSAATLIARQMAGKRRLLRDAIPWDESGAVDSGRKEERTTRIDQDTYLALTGCSTHKDATPYDLRWDLDRALSRLPVELRELCNDLGSTTITDIAKARGVCRSTVYARVVEIRRHFENEGIDEYVD